MGLALTRRDLIFGEPGPKVVDCGFQLFSRPIPMLQPIGELLKLGWKDAEIAVESDGGTCLESNDHPRGRHDQGEQDG